MNGLLLEQRADPFVLYHNGMYYFTASVPQYDRIELRCTDSLENLSSAVKRNIWYKHESGPMSYNIWAPEIHYINQKWYVYYAAGEKDDIWKIRPYVLECTGDNPMTDEWKECGPMLAPANSIAFTDFSLDATVFEHRGRLYTIWAQKVGGQFGPSNLYIAEMESPIKIKHEPVLLSTPEYDWEKVGFHVNEGAAVIKNNGRIFVVFSASSTGVCYCMGLLEADENADLLDSKNWIKTAKPVLQTDHENGIYGPGHNCFTVDKQGNPLLIYHARFYTEIDGDPLYDPNRHALISPLHFDENGRPILQHASVVVPQKLRQYTPPQD